MLKKGKEMKIGIIGAMDLEIEKLTKEEMKSEKTVTKAGMVFHVGRLGNTEAVIVKSGVGKVNAAICAQILIDCFDITHLINTGIAGSLCSDINVGDIVISTDAVYHDMDVTAFGYEPVSSPRWARRTDSKAFPQIRSCAGLLLIPSVKPFLASVFSRAESSAATSSSPLLSKKTA